MDILQLIILALIQALTEFLPISSSGHLALAGFFLGWEYQGLVVDLALHCGTFIAVAVYFRDELLRIAQACLRIRPGRALDADQRLGVGMVVATLPAAIAGLALGDAGATALRHPLVIATTLAMFALLLWWADAHRRGERNEFSLSITQALFIGGMQALALIPGVSRSGITMTAALILGLSRTAAARVSFLISVPVTALAAAHGAMEVMTGASDVRMDTFLTGAVLSAVFAFVVIHFFLRFVQRLGALPFVIYRLLFAGVIVVAYLSRQAV
jgi:undecaprenyl-diphosphatase